MIKYIGSKRVLVPSILQAVNALGKVTSVLDLFSGTSRVGHALKRAGFQVHSNDHNAYAAALATCYIQADFEDHRRHVPQLIAEFNSLPGRPGYFTATFCERSRFFQPANGARIDAIREAIAAKSLDPELEAIVLVALMEAADRVDSTTGVQMAYLKEWAPRSYHDIVLRVPDILPRPAPGKCSARRLDAMEAAASVVADVAYIDPPYNQHSYLGNYHIWESLVLWDKPDVYGVACKRLDCRSRRSVFNSRRRFKAALHDLLRSIRSKFVVISFNNEGYLSREDMERLLGDCYGKDAQVVVIENDHRRYVGARIGIYNPQGDKVGKVGHVRNKEYLYVVARDGSIETAPPAGSDDAIQIGLPFDAGHRRSREPATGASTPEPARPMLPATSRAEASPDRAAHVDTRDEPDA